jgi:hypothetical protein
MSGNGVGNVRATVRTPFKIPRAEIEKLLTER